MDEMENTRTQDPRLSLLLGVLYIVAGAFASATCLYSAVTAAWPVGAVYLIGLFGGAWLLFMGLRRVRAPFRDGA
jgi:uncharacterized membrane protein HdeD (DUF308 family)